MKKAKNGQAGARETDKPGRDDPAAIVARGDREPAKQSVARVITDSLGLITKDGDALRREPVASAVDCRPVRATVIRPGDPGFEDEANALFQRAASFALAVYDRCQRIFNSAHDSDITGDCSDPRSARLGEAKIAKVCMDTASIALRTYCIARGIALDAASQSHTTNRTTINVNGPAMINGAIQSGDDPQSAEIARLLATLPDAERIRWQSAILPASIGPDKANVNQDSQLETPAKTIDLQGD
mgnify:CR=1 FL=1